MEKLILLCIFMCIFSVHADEYILETNGIVTAKQDVILVSEAQGILKEYLIREGDSVKKDQIIARLDGYEADLNVKLAENELEKLTSNYEKIRSGALDEEIRKLETTVEIARIKMDEKRKEYNTNKDLFSTSFVSQKALDSSFQEYKSANAEYEKSVIDLELLKKGSSPYDILSAKADLDAQKIKLQIEKHKRDLLSIRSPIDGVCAELLFDIGSMVNSGAEFAKIIEISEVIVELDISLSHLLYVRVGGKAEIITELYPDVIFDGTIIFVSPVIDAPSKTFKVKISINNIENKIKPGLFAKVKLKN